MKVGLIDIDSKMPNLALMKLSQYHKQLKHSVELTSPLFASQYDLVIASKVFTYTAMPTLPPDVKVGGSGYDLTSKLIEPVEHIMPDYPLYPSMNYSLGFTTRGCQRKCEFCIVPEKEGGITENADIYEFWNPKYRDIVLLDNNILALPAHFFKVAQQIKEKKLRVDFNQGLDHRLLDKQIVTILRNISHVEYRFAFDDIRYEKTVLSAIELLKEGGINRCLWYVLVGFNSTLEEDLERLNLLKSHNQNAYVQRYNWTQDKKYIPLARWVNQHHIFQGMTWGQFMDRPENKKYREFV